MAQKIARALKSFNTFWHEDAIRMDSPDLLKQYAKDCEALICVTNGMISLGDKPGLGLELLDRKSVV